MGAIFYKHWIGKFTLKTFLLLSLGFLLSVALAWYRDATAFHPSLENQTGALFLFAGSLLGYLAFFGSWSIRKFGYPKPLILLGRISYSVYVLQTIFLLLASGLGLPSWLGAANVLVLTPLLSWFTFTKVEQPFVVLSRRLRPSVRANVQPAKA